MKILRILLTLILLCASGANAAVVFEDDFGYYAGTGWTPSNSGAGHFVTGGTAQNPGRNEPQGWTGWVRYGTATIGISPNEGRSNGPCLKVGPEMISPSNQVGLVKYLGSTGYNELYVRYYIKWSSGWRFGNGQSGGAFSYYKLTRMWQNLTDADIRGTSGVSIADEHNRGAIVWGVYDDQWADFNPYFLVGAMKDPVDGTVNCPQNNTCNMMYYFPNVAGNNQGFVSGTGTAWGPLASDGSFATPSDFHCVEFHIRLASSWTSNDGVWEIWVDGVKQVTSTYYANGTDYHTRQPNENLCTAQLGSGMNYITLHDNLTGGQYWSSPQYCYIDDVVVSTTYIGPDYVIPSNSSTVTVSVSTQNNQTVSSSIFPISGTANTTNGATMTSVSCPGLSVSGTTAWSTTANLSVGPNSFEFTGTDSNGKTGKATINVTYTPGPVIDPLSIFLSGSAIGAIIK